jgi:hypothetical protein
VEGLPQIVGSITWHSSTSWTETACSPAELDEMFGLTVLGVRCPKCEWIPRAKNLWSATVGITGIPSILADFPWNATFSGKSPDVSSVEKCLRTPNGTCSSEDGPDLQS